jgi:PAS fold
VVDALRSYLHQEDKTTNQFEVQHRLRSDDGKICWVLSRGQISAQQADGRPMKLDGVSVDISCQRRV